ncbi:DHA2 family efflux MFS transporter permease subunit [Chitinimonas taiwanensis]|uniref:MFS transporter, DHA2 family, multidrug resistance protein n=1 Tax=Chitinimonas taiwanensis DSM 18899 TaxID=1121279 RepID=A0A1K2H8R2_9NEIS|nr:DHA2 family efflux MFS transporter permease subunit [Chitinimonas taiwanensis]SFZ72710.1 MFS transporter, DHA2 family, multidrug resistance protein [Chitinimonas taiwanensis DSM 18899]
MKPFLPGLLRSNSPASIFQNRFIIAATVTLACVLELLDTSIVNVAVPHMMGSLGATLDEITWVSIGYVVANVIVLPISGFLANQFGRRNYLALSILIFTIASWACGNADSLGELVFWRIVQGLGGGGLIATAQATLYEVFPAKEMATAMSIFGMGIMFGPSLGPTVGGWITDTWSWPWIFYINLPLGAAALLLVLVFVPDSAHRKTIPAVDYLGLILLAVGVGALQLMLERGEKLEWFESTEIIAYTIASILALIAFVIRELEYEHPIVNLRIMQDSQFSAGLLFTFFLGAALFSTVFLFPVYAQTLIGFDAFQTGMIILPSALAAAFAMPIAAKLLARGVPAWGLIATGAAIFLYAMWGHHLFSTESGAADFFWPLILRGLGLGLVFMPLNNLTLARIQPQEIPNASGLYNLTRQLGGSVGIALSATLLVKFEDIKRSALVEHLAHDNAAMAERLNVFTHLFQQKGEAAALATQKAYAVINGQVAKQAMMLAFSDLFMLFGIAIVLMLPLLFWMRTPPRMAQAGDVAH